MTTLVAVELRLPTLSILIGLSLRLRMHLASLSSPSSSMSSLL